MKREKADNAAGRSSGPAPVFIPARQIEPLIDMALARGVRVEEILGGLGLEKNLCASPETPVLLADYYRIHNQISAALEDETCQLSTRQLLPGTTDFILSHMTGVKSLADAMKIIARSYNLLHGGEFNTVRRRGDVITFVIDDRGFPYTIKANPAFINFSLECVLIFLHCMLKVISPSNAEQALRKVSVTRMHRDGDAQHLACWAAPIRFGAPACSIDYGADQALARITPPLPEVLTAARVHAEIIAMADEGARHGPINQTEDFVRTALGRGVIDQTRIAALLGVSTATLRRRLEEEGASFRDLRQEVLNEAAKKLLQKRLALTEVAEELGFSEFRSFNRAFKAWNGVTPKEFAQRGKRSN